MPKTWRTVPLGKKKPIIVFLLWLLNNFGCCWRSYFCSNFQQQKNVSPKQKELESWSVERIFNPHRVICQMSCVTCHVAYVMCHMSHFMCHMSHVTCHMEMSLDIFYLFLSSFFWQSGGAIWLKVCYHWGLPCLVWSKGHNNLTWSFPSLVILRQQTTGRMPFCPGPFDHTILNEYICVGMAQSWWTI